MKTPMKTQAWVIAMLFATEFKKVKANCFETEGGEPIADCVCHETCGTCGYGTDPTGMLDCLTCINDDYTHYESYENDGSGQCYREGKQLCYEYEGDTEPIAECTCDNTCGDAGCGYNDDPSLQQDCIDCYDGFVLYDTYEDGTGTCRVPGAEACYAVVGDQTPIEGCMCHPTCGTSCAGSKFTDIPLSEMHEWPDEMHDCVDCADGLELFAVWADGTGYCLEPSVCKDYDTEEPITDGSCTCADNCKKCYALDASIGAQNCAICKDYYAEYYVEFPSDFTEYYTVECPDDGTPTYYLEKEQYYWEIYESIQEEEDEEDESSASTIQTGLAAVSMAVMLQF